MKARLAGAQKGHGLLKKKADALQMRFRQILSKIIEVCTNVTAIDWSFNFCFALIYHLDENIDGRGDERECIFVS